MSDSRSLDSLSDAIAALPQTKAALEEIPPGYIIATGHDDRVMLFLTAISNPIECVEILFDLISLSEGNLIATELAKTGGLLKKLMPYDDAMQAKLRLSRVGTESELVQECDT